MTLFVFVSDFFVLVRFWPWSSRVQLTDPLCAFIELQGIQQSVGWVHYALHKPEPGVLLFRRAKTEDYPAGTGPENINMVAN